MALGNWGQVTYNEKGEAIEGVFESKEGVLVEVYKNWLYIHDKVLDGITSTHSFTNDVIMHIDEGYLKYKDVQIIAKRKKERNALYFAVWTEEYLNESDENDFSTEVKGMIGLACLDLKKGITNKETNWLMVLRKYWLDYSIWGGLALKLPEEFGKFPITPKGAYNQGMMFLLKAVENKSL